MCVYIVYTYTHIYTCVCVSKQNVNNDIFVYKGRIEQRVGKITY